MTNSPVDEKATWFQLRRLTTSWNLCSTSSFMAEGSRLTPSWDRSGIIIVRMTRSELLTRRSRPFLARRRRITTPLQSLVEWIVVQVWVSMMLIQPFDVPEMIWLPSAVKMVTQVECFASCAACFAATAGSVSSSWGRRGAEGRIRFTGRGAEISTRTGCSSNNEATKSQLRLYAMLGCIETGIGGVDCILVKWVQFRNIYGGFESNGSNTGAIFHIP